MDLNAAHIHLILNHLPVVGSLGGFALLAYALVKRSPDLLRAAFGTLVLVSVMGLVTYLTGEPAEEVVEDLASVSEAAIETHEEAAEVGLILLGVSGAFALAGLILMRRGDGGVPRRIALATLLLSLVAAGAMGYVANLGGKIHHPETRPGGTEGAPLQERLEPR